MTAAPRQKSESRLSLRQTDIVSAAEGRGMPGPRRPPAPWIAGGLILQAVGGGGVAAYVRVQGRHQNIGGGSPLRPSRSPAGENPRPLWATEVAGRRRDRVSVQRAGLRPGQDP